MENCAILAHKSSLGSEVHRAPSRKGENSYVRKRSNVRNKLVIDVQSTANKTLVSPHPTTVKTQLREILNNAENYYNASEFYTGDSSKIRSRQSSVKREDAEKKGRMLAMDFEVQKQRLLKLDNLRLPKISEDKIQSGSTIRKPRPKNNSIDYNRSQLNQTMNNTGLYIDLQQLLDSNQERISVQPESIKAPRPPLNPEKVEKPRPPPPKEEINNENRKMRRKPSENMEYFNQDTYRTLTSAYSSRTNLLDPFEEIRQEYNDPKKAIKNVAEKHVELAYKKIDQIKKNFHRRNKTYWFNVPTYF